MASYVGLAMVMLMVSAIVAPLFLADALGAGMSILVGVGVSLVLPWFIVKSRRGKDEAIEEAQMARFEASSDRYSKQWYCNSCGEIFWVEGRPARDLATEGLSDWS